MSTRPCSTSRRSAPLSTVSSTTPPPCDCGLRTLSPTRRRSRSPTCRSRSQISAGQCPRALEPRDRARIRPTCAALLADHRLPITIHTCRRGLTHRAFSLPGAGEQGEQIRSHATTSVSRLGTGIPRLSRSVSGVPSETDRITPPESAARRETRPKNGPFYPLQTTCTLLHRCHRTPRFPPRCAALAIMGSGCSTLTGRRWRSANASSSRAGRSTCSWAASASTEPLDATNRHARLCLGGQTSSTSTPATSAWWLAMSGTPPRRRRGLAGSHPPSASGDASLGVRPRPTCIGEDLDHVADELIDRLPQRR